MLITSGNWRVKGLRQMVFLKHSRQFYFLLWISPWKELSWCWPLHCLEPDVHPNVSNMLGYHCNFYSGYPILNLLFYDQLYSVIRHCNCYSWVEGSWQFFENFSCQCSLWKTEHAAQWEEMVPSFLIDYNQIWSQTLQFFHLCEGAELICSLFMHGST